MRTFFVFLSGVLLLFPISDLHAFATKGQDCTKCHTLKKDEAAALMKKFDQSIKVLAIKVSSVKYLWEISIESNGKKGLIYIDFPKKHLFSGSILDIQSKKNLTQDRLSEINRVNVSQIPLKDALVLGDKKARHKVIVFDDPE